MFMRVFEGRLWGFLSFYEGFQVYFIRMITVLMIFLCYLFRMVYKYIVLKSNICRDNCQDNKYKLI